MIRQLFGIGTVIFAAALPSAGLKAQTPAFFEALPPHLSWRVERQRALLRPSGVNVAEGFIYRVKVWPPESLPIKICFFGGDTELRTRIREAAAAWTTHPGTRISFDFGSEPQLRDCSPTQPAQIRVGFAYRGYWSLIGQDSVLANQNEQTMNFQGFDIAPAPEPEFSRLVLHEFGHALGLAHEHQNPTAPCENEYNWPAVYSSLAQQGWSKDDVDKNMRRVSTDGVVAEEFDPNSIMLYTFPKEFYRAGSTSPCYSQPAYSISDADYKLAAKFYGDDPSAQRTAINSAAASISSAIASSSVEAARKDLALRSLAVFTQAGTTAEKSRQVQEVLSPFGVE